MILLKNSGEPIYQQIADQFRQDILTGRLKEGDYLPSIRGLASDLKISVITTMKAYEMLASEGLVTAVQGKGYYVNAQDQDMLKEQHLRKTEAALTEAIEAAEIAGLSEDELKDMLDSLIRLKREKI
ncbi:MAG: GntR family transcriptional regulator [Bilifractor sp.]|jgi:GntR family transcriptional regulator|nr:GntR family transcriptional regulator [Lachnospiraceae bacterium]